MKEKRLYIAYGSNLNLEQMKYRCPTAKVVGSTKLEGYQLRFCGALRGAVATIEPAAADSYVPVLIWDIQPEDELVLDRYEGYPHLYRKEMLEINLNGEMHPAMVYIMNTERIPYGTASSYYFNTILDGYRSAGFDTALLYEANNLEL